MNPLLQDFNTAPFSKISEQDYKPAIQTAIEETKKEIDLIVSNSDAPTISITLTLASAIEIDVKFQLTH